MKNKETIKQIIKFDPVSTAEDLLGEFDEGVRGLSFLLHWEKSKFMEQLMDSNDDTKFRETSEEYLRKVKSIGFEVVYYKKFNNNEDSHYIMWHPEYHILLNWDTFRGSRNSAKMYYYWSPNNINNSISHSGGYKYLNVISLDTWEELNPPFDEPVFDENINWEDYKKANELYWDKLEKWREENNLKSIRHCNNDAREALKYHINELLEHGTFVKVWKEPMFFWLLNWKDDDKPGYDYKKLSYDILNNLPNSVKQYLQFLNQ